MKDELIHDKCHFETKKEEQVQINEILSVLLTEMEENLSRFMGKAMVYKILAALHNFPKAMHGSNVLNRSGHAITCKDAWRYAQGYMDEKTRENIGRKYFYEQR